MNNEKTLEALLREFLTAWPQFERARTQKAGDVIDDDELEINGGDLVDWCGGWTEQVEAVLAGGVATDLPRVTIAPATPQRKVCEKCGSVNISNDALARWSEETQDWEISSLLDNADCDDCGDETNINSVDMTQPLAECPYCGWKGLDSFVDCEPGEQGPCPHCKALCHPVE